MTGPFGRGDHRTLTGPAHARAAEAGTSAEGLTGARPSAARAARLGIVLNAARRRVRRAGPAASARRDGPPKRRCPSSRASPVGPLAAAREREADGARRRRRRRFHRRAFRSRWRRGRGHRRRFDARWRARGVSACRDGRGRSRGGALGGGGVGAVRTDGGGGGFLAPCAAAERASSSRGADLSFACTGAGVGAGADGARSGRCGARPGFERGRSVAACEPATRRFTTVAWMRSSTVRRTPSASRAGA